MGETNYGFCMRDSLLAYEGPETLSAMTLGETRRKYAGICLRMELLGRQGSKRGTSMLQIEPQKLMLQAKVCCTEFQATGRIYIGSSRKRVST